MLDNKTLFRT